MSQRQRYAIVRLAAMAAMAAEEDRALTAAASWPLPTWDTALPDICLDFFSTQIRLLQDQPRSGDGLKSAASCGGAESAAKAGAPVLQLLQARTDLILPLLTRCGQRAVVASAGPGGSGAGPTGALKPSAALAAKGESTKEKQSKAQGSSHAISADSAAILPFPDIAELLLWVMRCRPLHPALVSQGGGWILVRGQGCGCDRTGEGGTCCRC